MFHVRCDLTAFSEPASVKFISNVLLGVNSMFNVSNIELETWNIEHLTIRLQYPDIVCSFICRRIGNILLTHNSPELIDRSKLMATHPLH